MSQLDSEQRALCATTASWLAAAHTLAMPAVASVALAALHIAHGGALWLLATLVLLLVLVERYLALRLAFDTRVFEALAQGHIESLADFDAARRRLGLGGNGREARVLEQRTSGAMRLWWTHATVVVLQLALSVPLLLAELRR